MPPMAAFLYVKNFPCRTYFLQSETKRSTPSPIDFVPNGTFLRQAFERAATPWSPFRMERRFECTSAASRTTFFASSSPSNASTSLPSVLVTCLARLDVQRKNPIFLISSSC